MSDHDAIGSYLDATLGDTTGWVVIARDKLWKEQAHQWPADRDKIASLLSRASNRANVYVSSHVLRSKSRSLGNAADRRLLHADVDHDLDLELVKAIDGFAVASGTPGHGHVFVRLDEPVSIEEYQRLCRALGQYLGGADAKISDNDVLRPPGTLNHKTAPPRPVTWLVSDSGVVWSVANLAEKLGIGGQPEEPQEEPATGSPERSEAADAPEAGSLPAKVSEAFRRTGDDRSELAWGLLRACHDAGWDKERTLALALIHRPTLDHFKGNQERVRADIDRAWTKPKEKQSAGPPSTGKADEFADATLANWAAQELGDRYCWVPELGGWREYDGRVWQQAREEATTKAAQALFEQRYRDEIAKAPELDAKWLRPRLEMLDQRKMARVVKLLRGQLLRKVDEFDQHPDLLNCPNGVVDLRTGELRPHDPDLLLTQIAGSDYRPGTTHPDWDAALVAVPEDIRDYLQLRFGQAATGRQPHDGVAPVLQGGGSNGKSTLLAGVRGALGNYARNPPAKVLMLREEQHSTEMTDFQGARFAYIEELPDRRIRGGMIKRLTGTPWVTARQVYKNDEEWRATHSLFITTNNEYPQVTDADEATWRRLQLVKFPYRFTTQPKNDSDRPVLRGLDQRVADDPDVWAAALSWLVEGARRWYVDETALDDWPDRIREDSETWRQTADLYRAFAAERLVWAPNWCVLGKDLYTEFGLYVTGKGYEQPNDQTFAAKFAATEKPDSVTKERVRLSSWHVSHRRKGELTEKEKPTGKALVWRNVRFRRPQDDTDEDQPRLAVVTDPPEPSESQEEQS